MAVLRSLAQLRKAAQDLKLETPQIGNREAKRDYVGPLQEHYRRLRYPTLKEPFGFFFRMGLESPQLALLDKNLKPGEQKELYTSDQVVFEEKLNGIRMILTNHPDEGFQAYSRNISVTDFLPVPYQDKLFIEDYKGALPSFVLDCELVSDDARISTVMGNRGVVTETILQAVASLLAMNAEDSIRIQEEAGWPLRFKAFDCLHWEGRDLLDKPYVERRKALANVAEALKGLGVPVDKVPAVRKNKEEFLQAILDRGGEGIIAKRIDQSYHSKETRPRTGWVKIKRSVSGVMGDTVDGFISGFEMGDPEKGFKDIIGCLLVSIFIEDELGRVREHMIAKVPNITLELRRQMTVVGVDGQLTLDPEYYDRVVEVEGQAISARVFRMTHPRLIRFRDDKMKADCVMKDEDLKRMVV